MKYDGKIYVGKNEQRKRKKGKDKIEWTKYMNGKKVKK